MGNYTPGQLAVLAVVCLAVAALVYIAAGAMGIGIPYWVVQVAVVCLVAVVIIAAIKFVMSL